MAEIWATGAGIPGLAARRAGAAERAGYDGLALVDSLPHVEVRIVAPEAYPAPIYESVGFSKRMVDSTLDSSRP